MHNKIFRWLTCVGISIFLAFGCCFFNPIADLSSVRPLIVHADDPTNFIQDGTEIVGSLIVVSGLAGLQFASKTASNVGQTVGKLWNSYVTARQDARNYVLNDFAPKVIDGSLAFGSKAVEAGKDFASWVKSNYDLSWLTDWGTVPRSVSGVQAVGDYISTSSFVVNGATWTSSYPVRLFYDSPFVVAVSTNSFSSTSSDGKSSESVYAGTGSRYGAYRYFDDWHSATNPGLPVWTYGTDVLSPDAKPFSPPNDVVVHEGESKLKDISLTNDQMLLVDGFAKTLQKTWSLDGSVSLPVAADNTISPKDLNDAMERKQEHDNTLPLDPSIPAALPLVDNTIPDAIPKDIDQSIPDVKPVPTTYDPPSITTGSGYAVLGLQDVFPFCIPFDIYNILSAFCATPETPVFTWNSPYGDVTFDFHKFDDIAFWWRKALVILFLIWLLQSSRSSSLGD